LPELVLHSKPQDICVVRLSAIGDTCHALAVIRRLQDNWPEARITWIIGRTEAALLADIPDIEFIIFDKSQGLAAYSAVRAQLRGRRFDVALCMHASMRANFLCRMLPTRVRLGFDKARARDFQWLFTNRRIPAAAEHAMDAMMGFATAIGAQPRPLRWDIPIPDDARRFAARLRHPGQVLVAISPCSSQRSRNFRNWSVDNYAAVIRYLRDAVGARVVLTGGPTQLELDYGRRLAADAAGGIDDLVGKTSLKELAALLAEADLVICPDSGPAHVAAALGTPVIGLYATSNPGRTGPVIHRELTVNRYPEAVRRYLGKDVADLRWGTRVRHPDAMDLITTDDVIAKIADFVGKTHKNGVN